MQIFTLLHIIRSIIWFLLIFACLNKQSKGTTSEAEESKGDAEHAEEFAQGVRFFEEEQTVGKTDNSATTADGADNGNHRVGITESKHINVVGDDKEDGDEQNGGNVEC